MAGGVVLYQVCLLSIRKLSEKVGPVSISIVAVRFVTWSAVLVARGTMVLELADTCVATSVSILDATGMLELCVQKLTNVYLLKN